jgi:DNA recombination protein RmuC
MEIALIIIGIVFIIVLVWLIIEVRSNRIANNSDNSSQLLLTNIQQLRDSLQEQVMTSQRDMRQTVRDQFSQSQEVIDRINTRLAGELQKVTQQVAETKETNQQVFALAGQLQDLEKVLKNQKTRGTLGELGLEIILSNILPPTSYSLQYRFGDGKIVDAIIKVQDGKFIPVDAKFSLDNYRRVLDATDDATRESLEKEFKSDLKKRIDETAQYIRPNEGTLPFAFMFIPAEGIYYDLLVNEVGAIKANTRNLIDYAYNDKKVIIVSPTTFSAYLQSVLYGFKAFQIEQSAVEIQKNVELLGRHIKAYDEAFSKLGGSLGTTINHYNRASGELKKIDKDVTKITGSSLDLSYETLPSPIKDFE